MGTDLITDPAYLVTRDMEDYVTWVDSSKIKRHIMKYNDALDDFDLLGEYICLFKSYRLFHFVVLDSFPRFHFFILHIITF